MGGTEIIPAPAGNVPAAEGQRAGRDGQRARTGRRRSLVGLVMLGAVALAGCSSGDVASLKRLGMPESASDRAPAIHDLWIGTWIAAGAIGVLVWGLILWAVIRYRRRNDELPRQNRYNLPMEVFYTLAPFIIIGVLFYYTILTQDKVLAKVADPDHTIVVNGQKWSWVFNYREADNPAVGADVWEAGTISKTPDLYLPVNQSVRFELSTADVIHSFWVPAFAFKQDVVPGRLNSFDMTPTREGVFAGKCAELCGTYHSAMLFNVHVVSEEEYNTYLKSLARSGQTGEVVGGGQADSGGGSVR